MNIAATRLSNINFSSGIQKKKQQTVASDPDNKTQNSAYETQYQDKKLIALQSNAGIIPKSHLKIEKLAKEAEESINSGLEDKILEYHTFVKQLLADNVGKNKGEFTDSNGVKYICMHNFHTIQVEQDYKGKSVNSCRYYIGYEGGKLPNASHQTAFISPAGTYYKFPSGDHIKYSFRDYNLDDEHGFTDAIINEDGNFVYIDTGHDAFAPVKTKYNYQDGILKSADVQIYGECDIKPAKLLFDKNRKAKTIFYDIKYNSDTRKKEAGQVFERNKDGGFVLVENN